MKPIICLVGESGSGKTTIAEWLEQDGFLVLPSYTTRPRRSEEERHHTFVTPEEFEEVRPHLVAHTLFNGYEYGATREQVENCDVYVIDIPGVKSLIERVGRGSLIVVYLSVSEDTRRLRMTVTRGHKAAVDRVEHDRKAFSSYPASLADVILRNETEPQLHQNIVFLKQILEKRDQTKRDA